MTTVAARPDHLPDFCKPPVGEVILGVQFNRVPGYQHICAGEVWDLFRSEYPKVQEQPPIPPQFETFGASITPPPPFMFMNAPMHSRYWFKRADETELIQFQEDRFLHNWKKVTAVSNEYPRYEVMINRFSEEFRAVQRYFEERWKHGLEINQCEISYINHITVESGEFPHGSDWFRFVSFTGDPEDFMVGFREIIPDSEGAPRARLTCEAVTVIQSGRKMLQYSLTVRGTPQSSSIDSALEFLSMGRDVIVSRFAETTTDAAHEVWERVK